MNVLKEEVHATVALKFAPGIGNNKGFLSYLKKKKKKIRENLTLPTAS